MKKNYKPLIVLIWILIGIFNYGAYFADIQGPYPPEFNAKWRRRDQGVSAFMALSGPFGLPMTVFGTGFCEYGWRLK